VPHLALGALLVLACATGFIVTSNHTDQPHAVWALTRSVSVGQVLTGADARTVRVSVDAGVDTIPATDGSPVGQVMAVSLPAGTLLVRAELGLAATPAAGRAVVAVLAKPGQFPPDLAAGAHVLLVPTSDDPATAGPASTAAASGVVTGVQALDTGQGEVVSIELPSGPASRMAALPAGQVSVVLVSARSN
jgi:hypothetical protein